MSKQLTLSAAVSVFAMAAFALFGPHAAQPARETAAATHAVAPALEAELPGS